MNIRFFSSLMGLFVASLLYAAPETGETLAFTVQSHEHQYEKKKLLIGRLGAVDKEFEGITNVLRNDLEFSGQWQVLVQDLPTLTLKQDIIGLFQQKFSFLIFINKASNNDGYEWRMYDKSPTWFSQPDIYMVKGAKYTKRGHEPRGWAHNIADSVWSLLSGQQGFFSTKLAYCKEISNPRKKKIKHIVVTDFDGSHETPLVCMPTVNVAPRWNNDTKNPLVFYSEYTNANVRLIAINMDKKRKIASNFDGLNMLPAFSADGKKVVFCASKGKGNCQLYYYEHGELKQLTKNGGNNISPTFSADANYIYFCSDFQTGQPQIYGYNLVQDKLDKLTDSGYCASPCYCPTQDKIAYSKIVQGVMQVFVYDGATKEHTQITFDVGNKEECSWSPCGTFLLFSVEHKDKSRIAMHNTLTNERHYITGQNCVCSYPSWSPVYEQFPVVI